MYITFDAILLPPFVPGWVAVCESCCSDDATHKRLEKIGSHSGNVSNVIPYVISNDSGIARVVLWNTSLDFADKIGSYICGLGVDSASDTGKKGYGTSSKSESTKRLDRINGRLRKEKKKKKIGVSEWWTINFSHLDFLR